MRFKRRDIPYLSVSWFTLYLIGTDLFVISPLLPLIAEHFQVSLTAAGWSMTLFAIPYAILAPLFGHYGDGHGRRRPIVAGMLLFAAANAASAGSSRFIYFLVSRFVAGAAVAAVTPTVYAATGDKTPPERRGAWLAFVGSGVFTALWSSAPLGSLIGYRYGWPWVFILLAIFPAGMAAANAWVLRATTHAPRAAAGGLRALMRDVSVTALWSTALYSMYTFLGAALKMAGCSARQIALAITVYGVGMVSGVLSGGAFSDRWGPRRVAAISLGGLSVTALILRGALAHFPLAMAALFIFAYAAALYFPAFQTYLAHRHGHRRGAALAWNNSALYAGITLGSFFGGLILERAGFPGILVFTSAVALAGMAWNLRVQPGSSGL